MFALLAPLVAPLLGAGGAAAAGTAAAGAGSSLLTGMASSALMGGLGSLLGGGGGGGGGGAGIPSSMTGMATGQAPQMRPAMNLSPSPQFADGGVMDIPQGEGDIASAVAAAGLPTDQRTIGLVTMLVSKGASVEQAINLILQKESGVASVPPPPPGESPQMAEAMDRGGMIRGPGTGVQDLIEGTIDNRQKVLLSDGEFVVPARVVSALGDGSSEAGAKALHGMMERVKTDAAKNLKTNGEIDTRKVLPA